MCSGNLRAGSGGADCPSCSSLCFPEGRDIAMPFPLAMTATMTRYVLLNKLRGRDKFPLVLMLEPLHACNLTCTGCGRIREYKDTIRETIPLEQCLKAVDECGAPIVSICGGEPMIYQPLGKLVAALLDQKKFVYLCTNGMF